MQVNGHCAGAGALLKVLHSGGGDLDGHLLDRMRVALQLREQMAVGDTPQAAGAIGRHGDEQALSPAQTIAASLSASAKGDLSFSAFHDIPCSTAPAGSDEVAPSSRGTEKLPASKWSRGLQITANLISNAP